MNGSAPYVLCEIKLTPRSACPARPRSLVPQQPPQPLPPLCSAPRLRRDRVPRRTLRVVPLPRPDSSLTHRNRNLEIPRVLGFLLALLRPLLRRKRMRVRRPRPRPLDLSLSLPRLRQIRMTRRRKLRLRLPRPVSLGILPLHLLEARRMKNRRSPREPLLRHSPQQASHLAPQRLQLQLQLQLRLQLKGRRTKRRLQLHPPQPLPSDLAPSAPPLRRRWLKRKKTSRQKRGAALPRLVSLRLPLEPAALLQDPLIVRKMRRRRVQGGSRPLLGVFPLGHPHRRRRRAEVRLPNLRTPGLHQRPLLLRPQRLQQQRELPDSGPRVRSVQNLRLRLRLALHQLLPPVLVSRRLLQVPHPPCLVLEPEHLPLGVSQVAVQLLLQLQAQRVPQPACSGQRRVQALPHPLAAQLHLVPPSPPSRLSAGSGPPRHPRGHRPHLAQLLPLEVPPPQPPLLSAPPHLRREPPLLSVLLLLLAQLLQVLPLGPPRPRLGRPPPSEPLPRHPLLPHQPSALPHQQHPLLPHQPSARPQAPLPPSAEVRRLEANPRQHLAVLRLAPCLVAAARPPRSEAPRQVRRLHLLASGARRLHSVVRLEQRGVRRGWPLAWDSPSASEDRRLAGR
eukprot:Rmarinus@m.25734